MGSDVCTAKAVLVGLRRDLTFIPGIGSFAGAQDDKLVEGAGRTSAGSHL